MKFIMQMQDLQRLIEVLSAGFDKVVGPVVAEGVVQLKPVRSVKNFPQGVSVEHQPGTYRITHNPEDPRIFHWVVGPESIKRILFPANLKLFQTNLSPVGDRPENREPPEPESVALIGARPCDVNAMLFQDKIFLDSKYADRWYRKQREKLFLVAVNCGVSSDNCFCTSMDTGPAVKSGHDIALTEVYTGGKHFFVAEGGTVQGSEILSALGLKPASGQEAGEADNTVEKCAAGMKRTFDRQKVKESLLEKLDEANWAKVADVCLACGNCTLACPTCFCSTVVDTSSLDGTEHTRSRKWDSCFTADHSFIHGGNIRKSKISRYRQWITHKLATWYEQFNTPGCVGCGRCITWCPVGIDLVKEATDFSQSEARE